MSLAQELDQFIGTENWYRHLAGLTYTDGIKHLVEKAGAYWLLDVVASCRFEAKVRNQSFQLWRLEKDGEEGAVVTCRKDTGTDPLYEQKIEYTDFPFDQLGNSFEWYVCDNVIL